MSSFASSTQRKFWTFSGPEELAKRRAIANEKYIASVKKTSKTDETDYLTPEEEFQIVKHYEKVLKDFLQRFMPKREVLPKNVKATAFHFFKRFFLVSSIMDFHPKEIMYACVYLSCKLWDYNVSIDVFTRNLEGNQLMWKSIIVYQESELLMRMNFLINIHTPYEALEGLMIDLKTRSQLKDPNRLYEHIHRFLGLMWFTDVCLLYSPSVIALAAVTHAASRCKENIDQFVLTALLNNPPQKIIDQVTSTTRKIRSIVMNYKEAPSIEQISEIEKKLAACRNPFNNPANETFRRTMMKMAVENFGTNNNDNNWSNKNGAIR